MKYKHGKAPLKAGNRLPGNKKFKIRRNKSYKANFSQNTKYISQFLPDINEVPSEANTSKINVKPEECGDAFNILWENYKPRLTPHIKVQTQWTSLLIEEPQIEKVLPFSTRRQLKNFSEKLYNDNLNVYRKLTGKNHQLKLVGQLIHSHGTTKDKIAQLSLDCMKSPLYSLNDLNSLIDHVQPNLKYNCYESIGLITSLFQSTYLPDNYVAKEFECHNFSILLPLLKSDVDEVEKQLILWYFESQIQVAFLKFVDNIEKLCHDSRASMKIQGILAFKRLLTVHPNQDVEHVIRKIINKFGDLNKKVCGTSVNIVTTWQIEHPHQRKTLIAFIRELLYQPNVSTRSQYYGLCCLKDTIFKRADVDLAENLIKLYLDFFISCTKSGEVDSRFMNTILRGLNRAYPYIRKKRDAFILDQLGILYKLCHLVHFNIGTQALQLIYQIEQSTPNKMTDRFYSLIYRKLLKSSFSNSSATGAFFNIIFKALATDKNLNRVRAFFRRLLQISQYHSAHIVTSILFMISEALKINSSISGMNVLFSSTKYILEPPENNEDLRKKDSKLKLNSKSLQNQGILHTNIYNPVARNPLYAGAHLSPIWEFNIFKKHFHPSVSLFYSTLARQEYIKYSGDPLQDYTLGRFLDRFTVRNPKKPSALKSKKATIFGGSYEPTGIRTLSINNERFKNLNESQIAPDELVFHRYYAKYQKMPTKVKNEDEEDQDEDEDDVLDAYLAKKFNIDMKSEEKSEAIDFAKNAVAQQYFKDDDNASGMDDLDRSDMDNEEDEYDMDNEEDEYDMDNEEDEYDMVKEESEDDIDDDMSFQSDEENDFKVETNTKGDLSGAMDGDSFSDGDLGLEDDEDTLLKDKMAPIANKPMKMGKGLSLKSFKSDLVDVEEFNNLLAKNAYNDPLAGTSEALFYKNTSDLKQLNWERKSGLLTSDPNFKKSFSSKRKSNSDTKFKRKKWRK